MRALPGLWPLRGLWLALAFVTGPALAAALDPRSRAVQQVASIGLWLTWGAVIVALLVPHPIGLTLLRTAGAALVLAMGWAMTQPMADSTRLVAVALSGATVLAILWPETTDIFVNGAAYGAERRYALRTPLPLLLGPAPAAAVSTVVGLGAAPLLLASRAWVVGAVALIVGPLLAVVAGRALHGLSKRWVVFVPAGIVLVDRLSLLDPVLFSRQVIESLRPAPVDTNAVDVSRASHGLLLEMRLVEPVPVGIRTGRDQAETKAPRGLLFSPLRPGRVLDEAHRRRIAVPGTIGH